MDDWGYPMTQETSRHCWSTSHGSCECSNDIFAADILMFAVAFFFQLRVCVLPRRLLWHDWHVTGVGKCPFLGITHIIKYLLETISSMVGWCLTYWCVSCREWMGMGVAGIIMKITMDWIIPSFPIWSTSNSGVGKCPNVSHHPNIGNIISNRYLFQWCETNSPKLGHPKPCVSGPSLGRLGLGGLLRGCLGG